MTHKTPLDGFGQVLNLLRLEPSSHDHFVGNSHESPWQRVYGGQLIAQGLIAAGRTVEADQPPHSLHIYFLRGADPHQPLHFSVDRTKDGRAFAHRLVRIIQNDKDVCVLQASFHRVEAAAFSHQLPMPAVDPPKTGGTEADASEDFFNQAPLPIRRYWQAQRPLLVQNAHRSGGHKEPNEHLLWMKYTRTVERRQPVSADCLAAAMLAYASDMTLLDAAMRPHGQTLFSNQVSGASLDHAMWFHTPPRLDDWLLYQQSAPISARARAMVQGRFFSRAGKLVASVTQEGLIRANPQT